MELKALKSGTDIRGTAFKDLTEQAVAALCAGFADFLKGFYKAKEHFTVALGHDSRISAAAMSRAAAAGLESKRCNVRFMGLCSTPSVFMTTVLEDCDAAIMLTASHHPSEKNGIKFFTREGGVTSAQLDTIISLSGAVQIPTEKPLAVNKNYLESYCRFMRDIFVEELGDKPLAGLKIAVDAGNGAAGFYAERILAPLGADISGSQYLEPDGTFPFHAPNPEDKTAMESISKRVVATGSDLGVIFDTDGDRSAIVLNDGREINRNRLIAMVSACLLRDNPGAYIVTDSVTSEGLKEFITAHGGVHIRYKRGYQNVIGYAKKLLGEGKNAILAIETSGHAALKENYFLDDGAYLAARLILEAVKLRRENKTLLSLIEGLKEPLEEISVRLPITAADFKQKAAEVMEALNGFAAKYRIADDSFEGIRVYIGDEGWFMARLSVHDPIIPINIESNTAGGAKKIAALIRDALKNTEGIDLSKL